MERLPSHWWSNKSPVITVLRECRSNVTTLFCMMEKMPEAIHQFASLWDYVPCAIPPKMAGVRTPALPTINVSTYDNGTLHQRPHWRIIGKYMFIPTYIIPRMLTLPKTKCKHFYQKERKQNKTTPPTTKHSKVQTRAWHFEQIIFVRAKNRFWLLFIIIHFVLFRLTKPSNEGDDSNSQ